MYEFMYYLKKDFSPERTIQLHENFFLATNQEAINKAEKICGFELPHQLKIFYEEIGYGQLQTGKNGDTADFNYVAGPLDLIAISQYSSEWLMPYSVIEPGVLPFFQRDVDLFLCLHPKSEHPNAVYWMWGEKMPNGGKICDSLVEFFKRLVDDPNWFNPIKQ